MSILLIGEKQFSQHLQKSLSSHKLTTNFTACLKQAAELLTNKIFKVIVCATPYDNISRNELLEFLKENSPQSQIIFIDEMLSVNKAIELVKKGLYTCIKKPFLIEDLVHYVKESMTEEKSISGVSQSVQPSLKSKIKLNKYVEGKSNNSLEMLRQIRLVGTTKFSVIIYGETGTGKESVAEQLSIEYGSSDFVAVDCGCLSKELAASELFGHEKGAFTGALSKKIGAFERANNGTLFLDEIGNLNYEVQTFLLRAIQERKIRRVGSEKEIPVNVRIVVASNENLAEKVRKGEFREDLYHRLNEFEINIPPLRERIEDLNLLANHFIAQTNQELDKNVTGIDHSAFEILKSYHYPGNIRELKNIIRRACLLTPDNELIKSLALPADVTNHALALAPKVTPASERCTPTDFKQILEQIEIENIHSVLQQVNYNKSKAASILKIDRKTLYNKLKKSFN